MNDPEKETLMAEIIEKPDRRALDCDLHGNTAASGAKTAVNQRLTDFKLCQLVAYCTAEKRYIDSNITAQHKRHETEETNMILADKIIRLRRKNGWSQEELAEKMNVSRQAVSKWESAQTVPDLEKILMLGALFGVTTDYLLKDELVSEEFTSGEDSAIRRFTLAEANEYLALRKTASVRMAAATFLCIVSVIPLLILNALAESPAYGIWENTASAAGLIVLFLFIAAAVAAFLSCGKTLLCVPADKGRSMPVCSVSGHGERAAAAV